MEEALAMFRVRDSYITSAGWLGYSDEKVSRLTREAVQAGFNHFKMKVGADKGSDLRRGQLIRSIINDPQHLPEGHKPRDPNGPYLAGKNAGPTGSVLIIDANQVWEVNEAIEYVKGLEEIRPWCAYSLSCPTFNPIRFIEEPTAPDDILGHAAIRKALKPYRIGVATGEHAHNRMVFKQLQKSHGEL
ncbi:hypothetical protein NLI96_g3627 [Meripilus lineatus]|uniref:Mandelate racemase/muconate lactonizing enzyme C-terminal domain-containing protein n=1 Tax=Meripilus lineatus TaxID=2056292 RepID=A0AAD5YGF4_9APHY|nr:hypothetical protein NLI96_g3627 [Physisporinus lineatus]